MSGNNEIKPLVSIICPAYNHEKFLAQALDGFVMQKTNFHFEIIVHDDASTDGTARIIREYEEKYHHLFRNIYQTENQFSKEIMSVTKILLKVARGNYIAGCEGDDYWTDPYKLQKQVYLLEANPHAVICGSLAEVIDEKGNVIDSFKPYQYKSGNLDDVKHKNPLITCTIMFRNPFANINIPKNISFGDWWLYHDLLQKKESCFLVENTVYARYRKHAGGITSVLKNIEFKQALINQLHQFSRLYSYKLNKKQLVLLTDSYYKVFKLKFRGKEYFNAAINLICYCYYTVIMAIRY